MSYNYREQWDSLEHVDRIKFLVRRFHYNEHVVLDEAYWAKIQKTYLMQPPPAYFIERMKAAVKVSIADAKEVFKRAEMQEKADREEDSSADGFESDDNVAFAIHNITLCDTEKFIEQLPNHFLFTVGFDADFLKRSCCCPCSTSISGQWQLLYDRSGLASNGACNKYFDPHGLLQHLQSQKDPYHRGILVYLNELYPGKQQSRVQEQSVPRTVPVSLPSAKSVPRKVPASLPSANSVPRKVPVSLPSARTEIESLMDNTNVCPIPPQLAFPSTEMDSPVIPPVLPPSPSTLPVLPALQTKFVDEVTNLLNNAHDGTCEFHFDTLTRIVRVTVKSERRLSQKSKTTLFKLMERDDIAVITKGLCGNLDPQLWNLDSIQQICGKTNHYPFRQFKRRSNPAGYEEMPENLGMRINTFFDHVKNGKHQSTTPQYQRCGVTSEDVSMEITHDDVIYLYDFDIKQRLPVHYENFKDCFLLHDILPGGAMCALNFVSFSI